MRILVVSPYLPHPLSGQGGAVFINGMIEHLAPRHEVTLVTFCDREERALSKDLFKLPIQCHLVQRNKGVQKNIIGNLWLTAVRLFQLVRSFFLWQPYYVSKYRHSGMTALLRRLTTEKLFDIVQVEFTQMGQYVRDIEHGKTFLHEIDVSFRPAYRRYRKSRSFVRRIVMFIEWCRWSGYERRIVRQFDHVLCVTDQDRMLLQWLTGRKHISYFPHAYDVPEQVNRNDTQEPESIVFLGSFSHEPNVDAVTWLCGEIFPLILQRFPAARLYVIGPKPPENLHSLATRFPGIKILGFVEDFTPYLRNSRAFVAPMRLGGGVKNKILVAMSYGMPVVTTKIGIEGIDGIESDTVALGDTAAKLAEQVCALFNEPQRAAAMGMKGRELVRTWYAWDSVISRLEQIYADVERS